MEHHPNGDGTTLSPIRPRYFTYSTWKYPTVEEALLGDFTKTKSTRKHKDVARVLFTDNLDEGYLQFLNKNWYNENTGNIHLLYFICASGKYSMDEMAEIELDSDFRGEYKWNPKVDVSTCPFKTYIWMRINCTYALSIYYNYSQMSKLEQFWNQHIPLLQHIDSLEPGIDFTLYQPLGRSYHDSDRKYIVHQQFQILDNDWSDDLLDVDLQDELEVLLDVDIEEDIPEYYYKCQHVLNKCQTLFGKGSETLKARRIQACFLDVYKDGTFEHKMQYYPYSNRAFTDDDLPDLFYALFQIPLAGLKVESEYGNCFIVRALQKCLPFASQSRRLTQAVIKEMSTSPAFSNFMSKLFWCMLSNMYDTAGCPFLTIDQLLRIDYLCHSPGLLLKQLRGFEKLDDACPILRLVFQLYILKLLENNQWYIKLTSEYVDWNGYAEVTFRQHQSIYASLEVLNRDNWMHILVENIKQYETPIHHYFDGTPAFMFTKIMFQILQREMFPAIIKKEDDVGIEEYIQMIGQDTEQDILSKENILNLLVKIPESQRYTALTISVLQLPDYGNVKRETLENVLQLVQDYSAIMKPMDVRNIVKNIPYQEFTIVLWYFHVITLLEKITLIPLPEPVVNNTDMALFHNRYNLLPEQEMSPSVYDVHVSLCCGYVKTLDRIYSFGTSKIVYDIDEQTISCAHSKSKSQKNKMEKDMAVKDIKGYLSEKYVSKRIRDMKTEFVTIPCIDNPLLRINLRGFMLRYRATKAKWVEYVHCPSCGAFHKYNHNNWDKEYRCNECVVHEKIHAVCCMCEKTLQQKALEKSSLTIINHFPKRPNDYIQHLYFCKTHRGAAFTSAKYNISKEQAFTNATKKVQQNMKNRAGMTYKV